MTTELSLLLWSAALALVLGLVAVLGALGQVGLPKLAGNREGFPEITGWGGRAARAHRNMIENLVLFAILALTGKALGISNAATVLGAQLFFWGRVAHAIVYIAGVPWVRTAAWAVSVIGLIMMFVQIVK
jgi:uncharacterized MAPEG superfamily protein